MYNKDSDIDLFFLTETWLSAKVDVAKSVQLAARGFDLKSFPRQWLSRDSRIATIYKWKFDYVITFKTNIDFTHTSFEVVQALMILLQNTISFCLYRHPKNRRNNPTDTVFAEQLPDILDYIKALPNVVCVVGNMNIYFGKPLHSLTKYTFITSDPNNFVHVINSTISAVNAFKVHLFDVVYYLKLFQIGITFDIW